MRNTARYLLGSLSDFDPATDSVPYDQLPSIDKYILSRLTQTAAEVERAYDDYQFYLANQALVNFANLELSAFYLDIAKDRLYISAKGDSRRRSCQTVLSHILEQLTVLMAPLVPHMAEEAWQSIPYPRTATSVFQSGWIGEDKKFPALPAQEQELWDKLKVIRGEVNKCIELARQAKEVGASMESCVVIHAADSALQAQLRAMQGDASLLAKPMSTNGVDDLRFLFLVSQVEVVDSVEEVRLRCPQYNVVAAQGGVAGTDAGYVSVGVSKAIGKKCDRCWFYSDSVGLDHDHGELCLRCATVVKEDKYSFDS